MVETILFYTLAVAAIACALLAITRAGAVMSAMWLVACLSSVAGVFALLDSPFLAVLQILIAAGAVMVLILFVVMLVDETSMPARKRIIVFGKIVGALSAFYLGVVFLLSVFRSSQQTKPASGEAFESVHTLGQLLFGKYALPFELVGALLLTAAVAAVVLAKRE